MAIDYYKRKYVDCSKREFCIDLKRAEKLACDTEFQCLDLDDSHTFSKGQPVTAYYHAVAVVGLPKNISFELYSNYCNRVNAVLHVSILLYGEKILDRDLLQKQLDQFLPKDLPCKITEMTRKYTTDYHTNRGRRLYFATKTEDLMVEKNSNNDL